MGANVGTGRGGVDGLLIDVVGTRFIEAVITKKQDKNSLKTLLMFNLLEKLNRNWTYSDCACLLACSTP